MSKLLTTIKHKCNTEAFWQEHEFTPAEGEEVIYLNLDNDNKATRARIKVGDGKSELSKLPWASTGIKIGETEVVPDESGFVVIPNATTDTYGVTKLIDELIEGSDCAVTSNAVKKAINDATAQLDNQLSQLNQEINTTEETLNQAIQTATTEIAEINENLTPKINQIDEKLNNEVEGIKQTLADTAENIENINQELDRKSDSGHTHTLGDLTDIYGYGTDDLEAGVSELQNGKLYFVYW